mmetsp:Transcript_17855/g.58375  ORF Transcript_17855/g.58375 Transcript_17855/m.58375 type:complete len:251 (-) Transcript_17855:610-1362(-)
MDRRARQQAERGRPGQAALAARAAARPRHRAGERGAGRIRLGAAVAGRAGARRPAHRLLPLPGPNRRRQDGASQGAQLGALQRRRAVAGPARYERVLGGALGRTAGGRAARLHRARRRRPADRGGPQAAVHCRAARRDREGAPSRAAGAAAAARRGPADRLQGPRGRLQEHGGHPDIQHWGGRAARGPARRQRGGALGGAQALPARVPQPAVGRVRLQPARPRLAAQGGAQGLRRGGQAAGAARRAGQAD